MQNMFPGWPGPINPNGPGVGGIAYPANPAVPRGPIYPGPGQQAFGQPFGGGAPGAGQALPGQSAATGPLAGLAAHGVPVGYNQSGQPVVMAGMANQGMQSPPNLPGMPHMPGPPSGLFDGGMGAGGLFQNTAPVMPFNANNLVQQLRTQQYQR